MRQIKTVLNIRSNECPSFDALKADGFDVRKLYLDCYFDGVKATKTVNSKITEVYVGTDNGDIYFTPQAYVDGEHIGEAATPEKAARMAEFRALMRKAA